MNTSALLALCLALAGPASAASLMQPDGVPDRFIGASQAPFTLIVYSAPTCPPCIRFEEQVLPVLKARYVDTGRLRITVRPVVNNALDGAMLLIADASGPMRREATLAHCRAKRAEILGAKDRGKALRDIAAQCGVEGAAYDRAMKNSDHLQALRRLTAQAYNEFSVMGTPSFFLNGEELRYDGTIVSFSRYLDRLPRP
jgi:protein-disulfide isomerase